MNKKKLSPNIILISAAIIGLTGFMSGVKKHETWQIALNAITLGLVVIAFVLKAVKATREKA
jgi:hypothetical protein